MVEMNSNDVPGYEEKKAEDTKMARVGNRVRPGRYTLGSWSSLEAEDAQRALSQRVISTQRLVVIRCHYRQAARFPQHSHPQEQITIVEEGKLEFIIDDKHILVNKGEMISVCSRVPHETAVASPEGAVALNIFLSEAPTHLPRSGSQWTEPSTPS
jgi:quercetin dioxygenase-like cupin family protein